MVENNHFLGKSMYKYHLTMEIVDMIGSYMWVCQKSGDTHK